MILTNGIVSDEKDHALGCAAFTHSVLADSVGHICLCVIMKLCGGEKGHEVVEHLLKLPYQVVQVSAQQPQKAFRVAKMALREGRVTRLTWCRCQHGRLG